MTNFFNIPEVQFRRRALRSGRTEAEAVLWHYLRGRQIFGLRFLRQFSIESYVLDFYCPKIRLAVELDGSQHGTVDGKKHDENRTAFLEEHNVTVMRFWNNDVFRVTGSVLDAIAYKAIELLSNIPPSNPSGLRPPPLDYKGREGE